MKLTSNFFVISDVHLGHRNIVALAGRPDDWDEMLVDRWNQSVGNDDKVLMLGDVSFTNKETTKEYFARLNGKIYTVMGNHDSHSVSWFHDVGVTVVPRVYKRFRNKYEQYLDVLFTHEPILTNFPDNWFNIHGHIHDRPTDEYEGLTDRHVCVSVEVVGYTPIRIYTVLRNWWPSNDS